MSPRQVRGKEHVADQSFGALVSEVDVGKGGGTRNLLNPSFFIFSEMKELAECDFSLYSLYLHIV